MDLHLSFARRSNPLFVFVLVLFAGTTACGNRNGGPGPSGSSSERLALYLQSSDVVARTTPPPGGAQNPLLMGGHACTIDGVAGWCVTPTSMSGHVAAVTLNQNARMTGGRPSTRLLGGSVGVGVDRDGRPEVQAFDFRNPHPIDGESQLESTLENSSWTGIDFRMASLEVQFQVGPQFWNVRFPYVTQPFTDEPVIAACGDFSEHRAGPQNDVISGARFRRGDLLVCVRDSADTACATADYQWVDAEGGARTSMRPTTPLAFSRVTSDPLCTVEGERSNVSLGGLTLLANLNEELSL